MPVDLEAIRARLVGKTVTAVERAEANECICRIECSDGSTFRLHATDLGAWVEDTVRPGQKYEKLFGPGGLFVDYAHRFGHILPGVQTEGQDVIFVTPTGETMIADLSRLPPDEQALARHPLSGPYLADAASLGGMAFFAFREDDCPEDFRQFRDPRRSRELPWLPSAPVTTASPPTAHAPCPASPSRPIPGGSASWARTPGPR
jgi:hypothetical protein